MDGSTEGNPSLNGETLEEENANYGNVLSLHRDHLDVYDWFDHKNDPIPISATAEQVFKPITWTERDQMKNWENRVYGGPQFERMIMLFKTIVSQPGMFVESLWMS